MSLRKPVSANYIQTTSVCKSDARNSLKSTSPTGHGLELNNYISTIPQELMDQITQDLPKPAIVSLRQSCSRLYNAFAYPGYKHICQHYVKTNSLRHCFSQEIVSSRQKLSVTEQLAFLELLDRDDPLRLACSACATRHQRHKFAFDAEDVPAKQRMCVKQKYQYDLESKGYQKFLRRC